MSRNITYENYIRAIKDKLSKYGYSSSEINDYLNKADIKEYVLSEYNHYVTEDPKDITSGGHSPDAVSYFLDLLY